MDFYYQGKEKEYISRKYQIYLQKCPQIEKVA